MSSSHRSKGKLSKKKKKKKGEELDKDRRPDEGDFVSSGGYLVVVEAEGAGETLHVMRRKIAVVR